MWRKWCAKIRYIQFVAAVSFKNQNFHTLNHENRQKNSEFREISEINPPSKRMLLRFQYPIVFVIQANIFVFQLTVAGSTLPQTFFCLSPHNNESFLHFLDW
jgi:hypothetical protein